MPGKSVEGFTFAYFFDCTIVLLTIAGPFVLPPLARFGTTLRVMAGSMLISLGLFWWVVSFVLDWHTHWALAFLMELSALILIPFSMWNVWLGVRILRG